MEHQDPSDPMRFTIPFALTKTIRREPYPSILPDNPRNVQSGKIIIITGAGSGIGRAAAKVWAQAKASGIVLAGRRLNKLQETKSEIHEINKQAVVVPVECDVAKEEDVKNLFEQVQKVFGRPADVLINNAGVASDGVSIGEQSVQDWWRVLEIDLKGPYALTHYFIATQPDPSNPIGTIINVASGRAGMVTPQGSGYNIAKIALQRLTEHTHIEYPTLRVFTSMPGIVQSEITDEFWNQFAHDHADLTGGQALYLSQPRADYLRGGMVGVNWDVDELEQHREEIESKKLLWMSWMPILPLSGGKGFEE